MKRNGLLLFVGLLSLLVLSSVTFAEMVISGDKVGIGTETPSSALEVHDTTGIAIRGFSTSSAGVYGYSSSNSGVVGQSSSSDGVGGYSNSGAGVYGYSVNGWAAYLDGPVNITSNQTVGGIVTAQSFHGDGSALTNVDAGTLNGQSSSDIVAAAVTKQSAITGNMYQTIVFFYPATRGRIRLQAPPGSGTYIVIDEVEVRGCTSTMEWGIATPTGGTPTGSVTLKNLLIGAAINSIAYVRQDVPPPTPYPDSNIIVDKRPAGLLEVAGKIAIDGPGIDIYAIDDAICPPNSRLSIRVSWYELPVIIQ